MSIIEKLKLLYRANKAFNEVMKMEKVKQLLDKMDGWKSVTGLLMVVAYYTTPKWNIQLPDIVLQIGAAWAGVGMAHKLDKATGILSAVLNVLTATNKSVNEAKKEEEKK